MQSQTHISKPITSLAINGLFPATFVRGLTGLSPGAWQFLALRRPPVHLQTVHK